MNRNLKIRDVLPDLAQILSLFHRLTNSRQEMRAFNRATMPQMKIASRIFTSPSKGVLAKDIATSVGVTPGAVSQTIALLERDGLVERKPDDSDRRAVRIVLTRKGRGIYLRKIAGYQSLCDRLFADIPASEQEVFASVLQRMRSRLDDEFHRRAAKAPPAAAQPAT